MIKDIQGTLRRLDEEITGREQQIAMHQVEIARLVTTRRTLMNIAESDIEAATVAKHVPPHLNGSFAKPMLIVRKTGTGDEPAPAKSSRRKRPKKEGDARGGPRVWRTPEEVAAFEAKIIAAVADKPLRANEIADKLGYDVKLHSNERKTVQNTLYRMEKRGTIKHVEEGWQKP